MLSVAAVRTKQVVSLKLFHCPKKKKNSSRVASIYHCDLHVLVAKLNVDLVAADGVVVWVCPRIR